MIVMLAITTGLKIGHIGWTLGGGRPHWHAISRQHETCQNKLPKFA